MTNEQKGVLKSVSAAYFKAAKAAIELMEDYQNAKKLEGFIGVGTLDAVTDDIKRIADECTLKSVLDMMIFASERTLEEAGECYKEKSEYHRETKGAR